MLYFSALRIRTLNYEIGSSIFKYIFAKIIYIVDKVTSYQVS